MGGASGRPPSHVSKHWPAVADRAKGYSCCVSNARSDHVSRGGLLGSVFVLGVPGENEAGDYCLGLFRFHPAASCGLLPAPRARVGGRKLGRLVLCLEIGSRGCSGSWGNATLLPEHRCVSSDANWKVQCVEQVNAKKPA